MGDEQEVQLVHITPAYSRLSTFDPSELCFTSWVQLFEEFCMINDIDDEADPNPDPAPHNRKRALFLTNIGNKAYEHLRRTCLPDRPNQKALTFLINLLQEKYEPSGLKRANRLIFSKRNQRENESAKDFIAAIQDLASKCDFGEQLFDVLLDRLISGIRLDNTRRKLLAEAQLTYDRAKTLVIQEETVRQESRALAQAHSIQVSNVRSHNFYKKKGQKFSYNKQQHYFKPSQAQSQSQAVSSNSSSSDQSKWGACHRCGKLHDVRSCPAINSICTQCGKKGHIAEVCHSKPVNNQFPKKGNQRQNSSNSQSRAKHQSNSKRYETHHVNEDFDVDEFTDTLLHFPVNYIEVDVKSQECSVEFRDPYANLSHESSFKSDPPLSQLAKGSVDFKPASKGIPDSTLNSTFDSCSILDVTSNPCLIRDATRDSCSHHLSDYEEDLATFFENAELLTIPALASTSDSVQIPRFLGCVPDPVSRISSALVQSNSHSVVEDVNINIAAESFRVKRAFVAHDLNSTVCANLTNFSKSSPAEFVSIKINSIPVRMEIDSGSGISIMSDTLFRELFPNLKVLHSEVPLKSVSGPIQVEGELLIRVEATGKSFNLPLIIGVNIVDVAPLLGRMWLDAIVPEWRESLRILFKPITHKVDNIQSFTPPDVEQLKSLYPKAFSTDANTCITGFVARLVLKDNATPVFHKAYPLPFGLIEPVNKVLDGFVNSKRAVRVRQSEWASPAVVVAKKGSEDIRFCVDFKKTLNPQLRIDHYPLPRPDDIFSSLSNGVFYTSLDLRDAYTQLELHSDSQELCVVNTHRGLYKFLRLIYGIASSAPIFQGVMDTILNGIPGVTCYIDNILIHGLTLYDCVNRTMIVLSRLDKHNVHLCLPKSLWFVTQLEHLGFIISNNGRSPAPSLTEAIVNCQVPADAKQVRSFLGMLGFFSQFLPHLSTVTKPLRDLTLKNAPFVWSQECSMAFDKCKQLLTSSELLVHFDPQLPIVVYTDASPVGVGSTICHSIEIDGKLVDKPICYSSSSLTPTQQAYAQIDREALAVIFAVTKFHRFLWGRHFTLITDNSAIQRIFHENKSLPIRTGHRLQHWAAILQAYSYTLVHRKSEQLAPADALSRLPVNKIVEEIFVIEMSSNLPVTPEVIAIETLKDPVLSKVFEYVKVGWPVKDVFKNDPVIQKYFKLSDSITIVNKCLLFSARVIIPLSLQAQVLRLIHEGHPGIVRSKLLARSVVWWPTLNNDIENLCKNCPNCNLVNSRPAKVYVPWPPATYAFERVHIDFFEFKAFSFFIYSDAYSKWLDVVLMPQCRFEDVEFALLPIFSLMGLPTLLVSDNGPPFDSNAYTEFCTKFNIRILRSPPYNPESNGLAERGVQVAKKRFK